jgi:hypothetical protein
MMKAIGPAGQGEAGVQLGGEPGPNTRRKFSSQYWREAQAHCFWALAHSCPEIG